MQFAVSLRLALKCYYIRTKRKKDKLYEFVQI